MWALSSRVKVYLASGAVDGRKGAGGLMALVQGVLKEDPYSGHAFVFLGRRSDLVKVLLWDRGGFVLLCKKLEQGRFKLPKVDAGAHSIHLSGVQLSMLLDGMDVMSVRSPQHWEPGGIDKRPEL